VRKYEDSYSFIIALCDQCSSRELCSTYCQEFPVLSSHGTIAGRISAEKTPSSNGVASRSEEGSEDAIYIGDDDPDGGETAEGDESEDVRWHFHSV